MLRSRLILSAIFFSSVSAVPSFAYDFSLAEGTYLSLSGDARVALTTGGDEEGVFARGTLTGSLRHVLSSDIQGGAVLVLEGQSDEDVDFDNRGDGARGEVYQAYVYLETEWGTVLAGKTFGAVTEMIDVAPSAIGHSYTVDTPFFMHVTRPRFAPRSPSMSPDFEERTERVAYYSPAGRAFQFGVSYAPELQDDGPQGLTNIHSGDALDVAASWTQEFSGGRFRVSGGYAQASANRAAVNLTTAEDQSHFSGALRLEWDGLTIGGGFQTTENTLGLRNIDNVSYQAGILYAFNNVELSASHGRSEDQYSRDLVANPILGGFGDARVDITELAARYELSQFWSVAAAAIHVDYQDDVLAPSAQNDGTYGVLQLQFGF